MKPFLRITDWTRQNNFTPVKMIILIQTVVCSINANELQISYLLNLHDDKGEQTHKFS